MFKKFLDAQEDTYEQALFEIRNGRKESHWIWFIFPQLESLGTSSQAKKYGIKSLEEARRYLDEPILRKRLVEISQALLDLPENNPYKVMGSHIDETKLQSSMTLFSVADPECTVFQNVLDKYYHGKKDKITIQLLEAD